MADRIVTLRCTKDVQWDDWGRLVTVFKRGQLVDVTLYENPTHTGWGGATYIRGDQEFKDYVPLASFQHLDGRPVTS